MIKINEWLKSYTDIISNAFGKRVIFIGLQGSYARNEETPTSDIDVVLILDKLTIDDLEKYRTQIDNLSNRDKICGFVSGLEELRNWNPSDLFQFYNDTKPIFGTIDFILSIVQRKDIELAVHTGACNIYHICVHNYLHERNIEILRDLYKSSVFVLQAKYFLESNCYISSKSQLLWVVGDEDKMILTYINQLKQCTELTDIEFEEFTKYILEWTRKLICITNI